MNDALVFALLFIAVGCGWWLGRRGGRVTLTGSARLPKQYYRGLNYLLDGRPDGAVDHFISALEVNSETLETHIALGNVLRRRGEVDRAIRIHENLLAREDLPLPQKHIAHLELARDYISAGLLDRAESLLLELLAASEQQRDLCRKYLIDIFRSERDWDRAIGQAQALQPRKRRVSVKAADPQLSGQPMHVQLAHFYCELALEQAEAESDVEARGSLRLALQSDMNCVRASLQLGALEAGVGNHRESIEALRKVPEQDADFLPEAMRALRESHLALGEEKALSAYLTQCLDEHPSTPLMIAVADDILHNDGVDAARTFLASRLAQVPSLRGLLRWIRLQQKSSTEVDQVLHAGDPLDMLSVLLERLIKERPAYRCGHCGFSARNLLWFCPGCKYWGTFRTIRTTEAE